MRRKHDDAALSVRSHLVCYACKPCARQERSLLLTSRPWDDPVVVRWPKSLHGSLVSRRWFISTPPTTLLFSERNLCVHPGGRTAAAAESDIISVHQ